MSTRNTLVALAVGGTLLLAGTARAADDEGYLFVDGYGVLDEARVESTEVGLGARLGIGAAIANRWDLEVGFFENSIDGKLGTKGRQRGAMLDLVRAFSDNPLRYFVFGGAGGVRETLLTLNQTYPAVELGVGLLYDLADRAKLRASISDMAVFNDDVDPDKSVFFDARFNVGLLFPFGATPAAAPATARVVDSDGDGLPDAQDHCPTVAAGTADGCPPPAPVVVAPPMDSDGDGIDDAQDTCPGTLKGMKVDARGCAAEAASIVLKGVTFLTGSSELTPAAKTVLDKAAEGLAGQASMNVEIGGHTDSLGVAAKNVTLSQHRADAVRQYLTGKGIAATRLTAKGYGSTQPIADNKTREGRAENRRVELKVVH